MELIVNRDKDRWIHPWNMEKFDDLAEHDDRFFAILIKGVLQWLNEHMLMYDKPIKHFILSTGSAYMYLESNGYEFSLCETSGEDQMYMEMPRCICEIGNFSVPLNELTSPYVRGTYERRSSKDNQIKGYNAEIMRLPIEMTFKLKYVFGTFNESIIFLQEVFNNIIFQKYFSVNYLGQNIKCSIQLNPDTTIEFNKPDITSTAVNQKNISFDITVCTNYPVVNERTEVPNGDGLIGTAIHEIIGKNIYEKRTYKYY